MRGAAIASAAALYIIIMYVVCVIIMWMGGHVHGHG